MLAAQQDWTFQQILGGMAIGFLVAWLLAAICAGVAYQVAKRLLAMGLPPLTAGNCLGVGLTHVGLTAILLGGFGLLLGAFRSGAWLAQGTVGLLVLLTSFAALVFIYRTVLMVDDYRRPLWLAALHYGGLGSLALLFALWRLIGWLL